MNSQQENQLSMYYVMQTFCNTYKTIWEKNKPFTKSYEAFAAQLPLIAQYRDIQLQNTSGVTQNKSNKREDLTTQAYFVANRLQSFATVEQKNDLLAKVNYPRSIFVKYRDTNLIGLCNTVLEQAQFYLSSLEDYSIDESVLENLQKTIKTYQEELGKPRSAQTGTKNATDMLKKLFAETNTLLNDRLDIDIEVFKVSNPDFYQQYFNARRITQSGSVKLSLQAVVVDAATQKPIQHVKVSFLNNKITRKTSEKGAFQIKNLPAGTDEITLEKVGYITTTQTFSINDQETTKLKLELTKEA